MEVLHEAPKSSAFVPLSEHQSATPASFYTGPPVLHYHGSRCKVVVLERDLSLSPALTALARGLPTSAKNGEYSDGSDGLSGEDSSEPQKVLVNVDIWVTSEKFLLFSTTVSTGLSIPYPSISLHAIQSLPIPTAGEQQGLFMQLIPTSDTSEEDEEPESISLTIVPSVSEPLQTAPTDTEISGEVTQTPVTALFTALTNCSNLHPDPVDPDDDDGEPSLHDSTLFQAGMIAAGNGSGGLPPPMPGSGGWITAENMNEFFDEQGNWVGGDDEQESEALGPGAGTVRARDEDVDVDDAPGENGDEAKWRKTS